MCNVGFLYLPTDTWPDCPHPLSVMNNATSYIYVIVCEWSGRESLLNFIENSRKGQGRAAVTGKTASSDTNHL